MLKIKILADERPKIETLQYQTTMNNHSNEDKPIISTTVKISRYYPAQLVKFGWPWLDPRAVPELRVYIQVDQDFASSLRENKALRHAMSDYLHGIVSPLTNTQGLYGKLVCGLLERVLRHRARFAAAQYRWASNHLVSMPTDQMDRLYAAVKLELRYTMTLLLRPKAKSVELARAYSSLATLLAQLDVPLDAYSEVPKPHIDVSNHLSVK